MRYSDSTVSVRFALLAIAALLTRGTLTAQPVHNSPYSHYGIGNLTAASNVRTAGMGNLGVAMRDDSIPCVVNFLNPASYTGIRFTAFDIGAYGSVATMRNGSMTEHLNRANISYFALGFPITKWWSGAFGLREMSTMKYAATHHRTYIADTDTLAVRDKFSGEGGLNRFFIGMGFRLFKNLSIGMNVSYVFGKVNRIQRTEFNPTYAFKLKTERTAEVGGLHLDYGIQYSAKVGKGHRLVAGATFAHPMGLSASYTDISYTYLITQLSTDEPFDTISYASSKDASMGMPWQYGLGLGWLIAEKWTVSAEMNRTHWSGFTEASGRPSGLADAYRASAGAEFRPSGDPMKRTFLSYFTKMHYRVGGHYGLSPVQVRGTQLPEYGVTMGLGFPMSRKKAGNDLFVQSMMNVSAEWGRRGTLDNGLILEEYWVMRLGFTLNDRWFIKRKYD